MGTSLSSVQPFDRPPRQDHRDGELPETEAWAIATAWTQQLKDAEVSASLVTDRSSEPRSIVDSYAWVRFDLPYTLQENSPQEKEKAHHAASIARAATLTWCALAHCRGYGAHERPAFWKRVFCELQPKRPTVLGPLNDAKATSVRDSIGFFDQPGIEFPRVMIAMHGHVSSHQIDVVLSTLCGSAEQCDFDAQVEARATQFFSRLEPFRGTTRSNGQSIDLCLSLRSSVLTRATPELLATVQAINSIAGRLYNPTKHRSVLKLQQLHLDGILKFDDDDDTRTFSTFVDGLRVPLGPCVVSSNAGDTSVAGFAHALRSLLGLNSKCRTGTTATLGFQHDRLADANFQALFSALPFASSIHSLSLSVRGEMRAFDTRELPWIAYAIFHPRASQSSWRHLELRDLTLRPEAAQVLSAMARGNNLLALLTGEKPNSDAYVSAVLECGSAVYLKPNDTAAPLITVSGSETLEVDVCGVTSSSTPPTWPEWVAVVVPAYGLGWVRSTSIVDTHYLAPSVSNLTGLRLERPRRNPSVDMARPQRCFEPLVPFIQELCSSLVYLDVESFGAIDTSMVQRLLASCPDLRALKAETIGELSVSSTSDTKLQELALRVSLQDVCGTTTHYSAHWLRQLTALRLSVVDPAAFRHSQKQIAHLLAHAINLRYLHWKNQDVRTRALVAPPLSYEARRQFSARAVQELNVPRGTNVLHAQATFSVSCGAAVVSVVAQKRREDEDSALGRLHADVLLHIFRFATSPVQRTICIEQE